MTTAMTTDCTRLTDTELADLWRDVHREQERRRVLAAIPFQVAAMTTEYVAGGGDRADLTTAVADAPDPTNSGDVESVA